MNLRRVSSNALPVLALLGYAVSCFLMAQYLLPLAASACGPGGGCMLVRFCWQSLPVLGRVPLPAVGMAVFAALLALSLAEHPRARAALAPLGLLTAAGGLALVALQRGYCHAWCKFCLATDALALLFGLASVLARGERPAEPLRNGRVLLLGLAGAATAGVLGTALTAGRGGLPLGGPSGNEPTVLAELPALVAAEQREGVATIVEFADFECPFCRLQHEELAQVLPSYGARVRFVRRHVPLARIHPHAEGAALAAVCAEPSGRGEAMADALFRARDLSPPGLAAIAARLGLDEAAFRACTAAPETRARVERERDGARVAGVRGLPTMFVGRERFEGVVSASELRASLARALRSGDAGASPSGAPSASPSASASANPSAP